MFAEAAYVELCHRVVELASLKLDWRMTARIGSLSERSGDLYASDPVMTVTTDTHSQKALELLECWKTHNVAKTPRHSDHAIIYISTLRSRLARLEKTVGSTLAGVLFVLMSHQIVPKRPAWNMTSVSYLILIIRNR